MQIRPEQITVFENASEPYFRDRMFQHVREAFPKHSGFLGDEGIREVVRYGIEQGRTYGFSHQSPVSLFTDLTLLLGRDFHVDPQLPWAGEILRDAELTGQLTKAERLHAAAIRYLDIVSGPDNEFIDAAQRQLIFEPLYMVTQSLDHLVQELSARLERIWPEKYRQLSESSRLALIEGSVAKARTYGIDSAPGALICLGMMYMLGSGFDEDPLFSWARRALIDPTELDQGAKIDRLHSAALSYLKQWCA